MNTCPAETPSPLLRPALAIKPTHGDDHVGRRIGLDMSACLASTKVAGSVVAI